MSFHASLNRPGRIASGNSGVIAAILAAVLGGISWDVNATMLQFTLETPTLSGTSAYLAFDFFDGDGVVNNTVTIRDLATDGALGSSSPAGGVSGTLIPGPMTLTDTTFFNSFLQTFTLGAVLRFTVELTEQPSTGGLLDTFAFSVLDATLLPLFDTTDPTGAGALFTVNIDGSPAGVAYSFAPTDPSARVRWTVEPVAAIPAPSTALLIGVGLCGGWATRRRDRQAFCSAGSARCLWRLPAKDA
ncbi:MAG: NF038129 family PEP-CTERM protein [Gammaproteobacteria bacterium]|nr:NF038129 family PEP-CTERM protein [Gammaproteobacteria bacterium]